MWLTDSLSRQDLSILSRPLTSWSCCWCFLAYSSFSTMIFFIKTKLSYVCMIFFVIENKVEACCIEEQHSRHGNKKVRLDNSSLFTVLRVIGLIKTTLVIFYICFMGYIICKTIVPISHVSFCPLITAYHIP